MEYQFESLGPALRLITLVFLFVAVLAAVAVAFVVAALPGKIAASRNHPQSEAVNICGWLGLPTGILWVLAMVWAFYRSDDQQPDQTPQLGELMNQIEQLERSIANLESTSTGATR